MSTTPNNTRPSPVTTRPVPWSFHLRLDRSPLCPLCGVPLISEAVRVARDVAFCEPCTRRESRILGKIATATYLPGVVEHCFNRNGITWWSPPHEARWSIPRYLQTLLGPLTWLNLEDPTEYVAIILGPA